MEKTLKASDFRLFIGCPCYIGSVFGNEPIVLSIDGVDASHKIGGIDIENNKVIIKNLTFDPREIKLGLRRFENLSRHEVEGLNKLWPSESITRTTFDSIKLDAEIINYLTALNVDVFGWIDQNLAIDVAYNNH